MQTANAYNVSATLDWRIKDNATIIVNLLNKYLYKIFDNKYRLGVPPTMLYDGYDVYKIIKSYAKKKHISKLNASVELKQIAKTDLLKIINKEI